ncbi:MAG: XdhC family protein [Chitinophagaceae bacterium]|nr:XdhC family protein [Chitinophagaceae bacterium]
MHKQLSIWRLIHKSILKNIPVMLLYVLESRGSSPGRQGFFMAVTKDDEMEGSIGGGIMEHKFVEMAKERLRASKESKTTNIRKQIHDKSAAKNQSGMICSGEQTNFLYLMQGNDRIPVENLIRCLGENKNGVLQLSSDGFSFSENVIAEENFHFEFDSEQQWLYQEKIGYKNTLFIIGGGHCALAFSRIMSMMDFYIQLFDTRPDLHTMIQNDHVHQKRVIKGYSELKELISSGRDHFVVVMTFGYRTDETAVKALLSKEFRYFGLLGSSKKIKKLLADLKKEGFSQEQLNRIHAPVGLPINSQTPEEIAISIAAQVIQIKNKDVKNISDPELKKTFSH